MIIVIIIHHDTVLLLYDFITVEIAEYDYFRGDHYSCPAVAALFLILRSMSLTAGRYCLCGACSSGLPTHTHNQAPGFELTVAYFDPKPNLTVAPDDVRSQQPETTRTSSTLHLKPKCSQSTQQASYP